MGRPALGLQRDGAIGQVGEPGEVGAVQGLARGWDLDGGEHGVGRRRARADRLVELLDVAEVQPRVTSRLRAPGAHHDPAQWGLVGADGAVAPEQFEDAVVDPHVHNATLEDHRLHVRPPVGRRAQPLR